jgi:dipeptidyl aminopeptidase/acylaminoacyl peptidase
VNKDKLRQVAWIGDDWVKSPIRGVVLSFHGLGAPGLKTAPSTEELGWAQAGGLVVFPYYGPWSWMNRQARALVGETVDGVYAAFGLSRRLPLISTGGSMGGCSALLYARYAKRPVTACFANYPVCDTVFHFSERPDLPRTFHTAFVGYKGTLKKLLAEHSPLAQVPAMPDIPYLIVHGDKDTSVGKARHSDRMVAALRRRKLQVEYIEVPGMGHGGPVPVDVLRREVDFVAAALTSSSHNDLPF